MKINIIYFFFLPLYVSILILANIYIFKRVRVTAYNTYMYVRLKSHTARTCVYV